MMRLHLSRHSLRHSYGWLAVVCLGAYSCRNAMEVTSREVPSAGGSQSADPALALDPVDGDLVMSWVEGDGRTWALYAARSAKSGDWSAPVRVANGAAHREASFDASDRCAFVSMKKGLASSTGR